MGAVTAFLEQGYNEGDLEDFWSSWCGGINCGLGSPKLVGDATAGSAGTEAMLDIETITGIFTLLNYLRMQNGGSPLGFLNPLIYENAAAFNDITTGSSNSCGGWPAKAGWDAVTGVGTPDFAKLAQVVAPSTLVV